MPSLKEIKDLVIKYAVFCVTVPPRHRRGTAIVFSGNVVVPIAVPVAVPIALPVAPILPPSAVGIVRPLAYFKPGAGGDCIDVSINRNPHVEYCD
ncbi:hypothetical protein DPMN_094172 [Dreissena polymorpha]|uniref:Uncharacterized protein n=1 Tax=Dreissena polymorpha TaxID=45954 RepID=A0A9D4L5L9_DREPO|nr:hypothetical protein DPMN_094172 [Dreissena polymorpha]